MTNEPVYDKLIGLGMVIVGFLFIGWRSPSDGDLLLAGLTIIGGISTVINAQKLGLVLSQLGQAQKLIAPLGSSGGSSTGSPESASSTTTTTDQAKGGK